LAVDKKTAEKSCSMLWLLYTSSYAITGNDFELHITDVTINYGDYS